jgi:hypothetical protein
MKIEVARDRRRIEHWVAFKPDAMKGETMVQEMDMARVTEGMMLLLRLHSADAATLMDELWRVGLRPSPDAFKESEDRKALRELLR